MDTLQNVKDKYYEDLANLNVLRMGLDKYIREYYVPCYDGDLNFLGYERKDKE